MSFISGAPSDHAAAVEVEVDGPRRLLLGQEHPTAHARDVALDGFGGGHVAQREHLTLLLRAHELVEGGIDRGAVADHGPHRVHPFDDRDTRLGSHGFDLVAPELHGYEN